LAVTLFKDFSAAFPSPAAKDKFIDRFKAWKAASDPCSFREFGRDVSTKVPVGHHFDKLMHVHLIPLDDEDSLQTWEWRFKSKTFNLRCDRTSDRLLIYAAHQSNYLLIGFFQHSTAFTPNQIMVLCDIADRWVQSRKKVAQSPTP
jgi:hypothetical protein